MNSNKTFFNGVSKVALSSLLGVSLLLPIASADDLAKEKVDPAEIVVPTFDELVETIESDKSQPKPSFTPENNTDLLVKATIVNGEADKLTGKATSLSINMEADMTNLKEQVEQHIEEQKRIALEKKRQEHIQALKSTNPNANIVVTTSFEEFVKEAKKHRFVNYDARTPSNLTGAELDRFIEGTRLHGLGEAYARAEAEYGVSAFVLMALSIHESNWGKSRIAQDKNNLFGYRAYDRDPYNSAAHFETAGDGIMTVASHLSRNYLTKGAKYYNGYTLAGMNVKYASDLNWNNKITNIMNRLVDGL